MNKKLISLFAACSMVATVSVGLVQTAYAAEPTIRIEVADGETDEQKVLNFYYVTADGPEGVNSIQGNLTFDNDAVTIDSINVTIPNDNNQINKDSGLIMFTAYEGTKSDDGSFATVNVTVPTDVDIKATFTLEVFEDTDYTDYTEDIVAVNATIPKKAAPAPAREFSANKDEAASFSTDDGYDANMVAAKYTLTIENGSYDLADAAYNGNTSEAITAADGSAVASTVITGAPTAEAVVFVVINGTADLAELDNVVFE